MEYPEKILHVGFGKTATTTLQLYIFPKLAKEFGLDYIGADDPRLRLYYSQLLLGKDFFRPFRGTDKFIVSMESLHSWDPYFWEEWADKNLRFFGKECHVLLSIREPASYLTGAYLQLCLQEGSVQDPNEFFLNDDVYSPYLACAKFAIDRFSYQGIIDLYRARFAAVTVVKYEAMPRMAFLKEILPISDDELAVYSDIFSREKVNRSYGVWAVKATRAFQRVLDSLGLSLKPASISGSLECLEMLRGCDNELRPEHVCRRKTNNSWFWQHLVNNAAKRLRWQSWMYRLERYSRCEFTLDWQQVSQVNIAELSHVYRQIPEVTTLRRFSGERAGMKIGPND